MTDQRWTEIEIPIDPWWQESHYSFIDGAQLRVFGGPHCYRGVYVKRGRRTLLDVPHDNDFDSMLDRCLEAANKLRAEEGNQ